MSIIFLVLANNYSSPLPFKYSYSNENLKDSGHESFDVFDESASIYLHGITFNV